MLRFPVIFYNLPMGMTTTPTLAPLFPPTRTRTPTATATATVAPSPVTTVSVPDANWLAVDPVSHSVFVSARSTNQVYYMNGQTLHIDGSIEVGPSPFGVAANLANRLLYVANYGNGSVSIIDMDAHAVVATHLTGGGPTFPVVDTSTGNAFVPLHPTDRVARFVNSIYLGTFRTRGDQVFATALDTQSSPKRLYIGRRGHYANVEVYDADTASPTYITTLTPGGEVYNMAVNENNGDLYVLHTRTNDGYVGFLTVYGRSGVKLTSEPIDVGVNTFDGGGLAIVQSSGHVYVAGTECIPGTPMQCSGYTEDGAIAVLRGMPPAVFALLDESIPSGPFGVDVDESLHRVYVSSKGNGGWVSVIDDLSLATLP